MIRLEVSSLNDDFSRELLKLSGLNPDFPNSFFGTLTYNESSYVAGGVVVDKEKPFQFNLNVLGQACNELGNFLIDGYDVELVVIDQILSPPSEMEESVDLSGLEIIHLRENSMLEQEFSKKNPAYTRMRSGILRPFQPNTCKLEEFSLDGKPFSDLLRKIEYICSLASISGENPEGVMVPVVNNSCLALPAVIRAGESFNPVETGSLIAFMNHSALNFLPEKPPRTAIVINRRRSRVEVGTCFDFPDESPSYIS